MTALRAIKVTPYTPPVMCTVAFRAHFLGAGRSRVAMLERFVDRDVWAFETALEERDLPCLLVVAMVRGRSCAEVANALAACITIALADGVATGLEVALVNRVYAALRLATSSRPDRGLVEEMRVAFVALRSRTELAMVVAEMLDLVGRHARAGAGGSAERCADRLVHLVESKLGRLQAKPTLAPMFEHVDKTLGPAAAVTPETKSALAEAAE